MDINRIHSATFIFYILLCCTVMMYSQAMLPQSNYVKGLSDGNSPMLLFSVAGSMTSQRLWSLLFINWRSRNSSVCVSAVLIWGLCAWWWRGGGLHNFYQVLWSEGPTTKLAIAVTTWAGLCQLSSCGPISTYSHLECKCFQVDLKIALVCMLSTNGKQFPVSYK